MTGKALVIGHLCLDIIPTWTGERWPGAGYHLLPGRVAEIGPATFAPGGAVANTGISLDRLGIDTSILGPLGTDEFGQILKRSLAACAPTLAAELTPSPGAATSYTIIFNPPGADRSFLHFAGANTDFTAQTLSDQDLARADLLHLGYPPLLPAMLENSAAGLRELLSRAGGAGLTTSVDMCMVDPKSPTGAHDWPHLLAAFLPLVDLFMPSIEELEAVLHPNRFQNRPAERTLASYTDNEIEGLARECRELGARCVVLKLGNRGLYLQSRSASIRGRALANPDSWQEQSLWSPALEPLDLVGATGAGDCAIAGILAAIFKGAGPKTALRYGTAAGSLCLEAADATSGVKGWDQLVARARQRGPLPEWVE